MLKQMFTLLFGTIEECLLERRILIMAGLLICVTGILTTVQNIILHNPVVHNLFSGGAAVVGFSVFWVARKLHQIERVSITLSFFFLIALAIGWFVTNGTYGAMLYFYMMAFILAVIILPPKTRTVFIIAFTIVLSGLVFIEVQHPEYLLPYSSVGVRYYDIFISYFISLFVTGLLVFFVVKEYHRERKHHTQLLKEVLERKSELEQALTEIKTLKGFLPICANCKKIRDDDGYWQEVASYISTHTDTKFSHGICPACCTKLYPDFVAKDPES